MAKSLGSRMRSLQGEERLKALGSIVASWRASGKSQAAFSRELGVASVTLGRWVRELEARNGAEPEAPVFVELGGDDDQKSDVFELLLPDGTRVRVPAGFREPDLARLLRVLSSTC